MSGEIRPRKNVRVKGSQILLRLAERRDAEYVLGLRLNPEKNQHLSFVADDIDAQREWIAAARSDPMQAYFVIERHDGVPCGTVRVYDPIEDSVCWGSWILDANAPRSAAVESTILVYHYILASGFKSSHFDVRQGNVKVWQYHERLGATRTGETGKEYLYSMSSEAIRQFLTTYRSRVPSGVQIDELND